MIAVVVAIVGLGALYHFLALKSLEARFESLETNMVGEFGRPRRLLGR